ncbi:hypothetical protein Ssi02_53080 [Sinosporangium siamense]|uniref:Uncharacterized protein n=1 Tax=Sinosporangium siamense TaxID=1367973 RepID=A0A919RJP6_9ACTN|nr:hypothetical protein Ssi02_53080 [Sinosporangium siamense]
MAGEPGGHGQAGGPRSHDEHVIHFTGPGALSFHMNRLREPENSRNSSYSISEPSNSDRLFRSSVSQGVLEVSRAGSDISEFEPVETICIEL